MKQIFEGGYLFILGNCLTKIRNHTIFGYMSYPFSEQRGRITILRPDETFAIPNPNLS